MKLIIRGNKNNNAATINLLTNFPCAFFISSSFCAAIALIKSRILKIITNIGAIYFAHFKMLDIKVIMETVNAHLSSPILLFNKYVSKSDSSYKQLVMQESL